MEATTEPTIYFMPLFFAPNSWVGEVHDKSLVPLMVKVVTVPHRTYRDVIEVELADVFSVAGYMPPTPKAKASKANLLLVIRDAVAKRTGKTVEMFSEDIIIYGGKGI